METPGKFKSRKEWSTYVWARLLKDAKNPSFGAALNSLLSSYEKGIIVNRLIALSLIKKGKTYKQIGEELWLSPTTIRSLKKITEKDSAKEYQSYRFRKNIKNIKDKTGKTKKVSGQDSFLMDFMDWIDYFISVMPERTGRRWKWKFQKN